MTTVMGYADLLATDHEAPEGVLDRIHETAEALTDLGDKAREIEGIMAASDATDDETDLAQVVRYVASEARTRYPDAEIKGDLDGVLRVAAPEAVCWPVVWNLVENAVEHHDRDDPHVELAVRVEGDRAVVAVTDDGPGLPASERQAIVEGEEQPLSHGSGLGLWAVKWGATRVGGGVSFDDAEPRGTRITVRFPLATAGRDAEVG
jgi:signal transduction histidine kinase